MTISVGLQAGFGSPLAAEFVGMASYGFRVVRQDLFAVDPQSVPALIAEFVGAPCRPLFLVGGGHIQVPDGSRRLEPTELAAMTTTVVQQAEAVGLVDYALEVGNEPDIAHPGYADHPEEFAEAVRTCRDAARAAGFAGMVVSGGIANLNDRGFRYLSRMIGSGKIPNDVAVGFHRYPILAKTSTVGGGLSAQRRARPYLYRPLRRTAHDRRVETRRRGRTHSLRRIR
jgi:hypothetical protein